MGASFVKVQSIRISAQLGSCGRSTHAGLRIQFRASRSGRFGHLTFRSPAGECSMAEKEYLDPKGYWGDPAGNIRRMSGGQESIATGLPAVCCEAEWNEVCRIGAPKGSDAVPRNISGMPQPIR